MKISIVMAYYNRKKLLENTLINIQNQKIKDLEIIVVDDASIDSEKLNINDYDLDVKLFEITSKEKTWINPCIPNNIGFSKASGDIIIIQNPECLHQGKILQYILDNISNNIYLNFSCFSINKKLTDDVDPHSIIITTNKVAHTNGENGWYNHPIHKPTGYHFCSAIMKEDLYDLGGFDERYADGLAYDDNEFLYRIKLKKMYIKYISFPYIVHQFHENVADRSFVKKGMGINHSIFETTLKDNNYDVKKYNRFYR